MQNGVVSNRINQKKVKVKKGKSTAKPVKNIVLVLVLLTLFQMSNLNNKEKNILKRMFADLISDRFGV